MLKVCKTIRTQKIAQQGLCQWLGYQTPHCIPQNSRAKNGSSIDPLPNDKVLDCSKLKELADDKLSVIGNLKLVLGWVENTVGKGENVGYQHFLLFLKMFSKGFLPTVVKSWGLSGKGLT